MAKYSIATAALALRTTRKRLENILSRYGVAGEAPGRQGRARRLPREAIVALAAVLDLQDHLGLPVRTAAEVATDAVRSGGSVRAGILSITLDLAALGESVDRALGEALLMAPRPRRGRPPKR